MWFFQPADNALKFSPLTNGQRPLGEDDGHSVPARRGRPAVGSARGGDTPPFRRFHPIGERPPSRVPTRASGIGLALVRELIGAARGHHHRGKRRAEGHHVHGRDPVSPRGTFAGAKTWSPVAGIAPVGAEPPPASFPARGGCAWGCRAKSGAGDREGAVGALASGAGLRQARAGPRAARRTTKSGHARVTCSCVRGLAPG